jgi:uridine kinase
MLRAVLTRARHLLDVRRTPIVIALDGPSGAGKSSVATRLATELPAAVIPADDFFAADVTAADWNARSPAERARDALDWRKLRRLALEPLRDGRPALWHPFDFAAGERPDGSYATSATVVHRLPAPVILVDGAYSSRPELTDLIDLSVLIDAPVAIRHQRLAAREPAAILAAWHRRWDAAEAFYFAVIRPPTSFDVVLDAALDTVPDRPRPAGSDAPAA